VSISATMICDSVNPQGIRLRCFEVVCHRFILPEINTHRVFSRNWASSRAIPTKKLIHMVRTNPATPVHWGKNQPGMQAHEELDPVTKGKAQDRWQRAAEEAAWNAEQLLEMGAHKQIVNRILEPFLWVRGVISSTDMNNFYALRAHPDAQPEIKALANAMYDAEATSIPKQLSPGEWHLPYIDAGDWVIAKNLAMEGLPTGDEPAYWQVRDTLLKVSVARCARVSYLTHDGRMTTVEEDVALYNKLVVAQPLHASPAEHQATPDKRVLSVYSGQEMWARPKEHGNFRGWVQHRKLLPNEFVAG
jgi:thymidylate synthase ThyX